MLKLNDHNKIKWALENFKPKEPKNAEIKIKLREWLNDYIEINEPKPDIDELETMADICDWLSNDLRRILKTEKNLTTSIINHIRGAYAELQTYLMQFEPVEKPLITEGSQPSLF